MSRGDKFRMSAYGVQPRDYSQQHRDGQDFFTKIQTTMQTNHSGTWNQSAMSRYRLPAAGDAVEISGLSSRPELNGTVGQILSGSVDGSGRIIVRLNSGGDASSPSASSRDLRIQLKRLRRVPGSESAPSLPRILTPFQVRTPSGNDDPPRPLTGLEETSSGGPALSAPGLRFEKPHIPLYLNYGRLKCPSWGKRENKKI
mmetsp:Transcript_137478/g.342954  ORF Transcript_137478/g.342954 Transcript_137478/m.342954 type:complete len:200 (-) Transcript_137478:120-719(-)|eukprot:CAMPEP_0115175802 /NCGR_PEP_ID=MMETSP0270-20121206/4544_1 /TAXON_ID=71861 /ORGANISM="Scrippsiella trochoidea, Strain CCMP3099" /LENGTH=199 /DNA_ID=CAMNT_0002588687 /DNA_START=49 /DNA_END=648 /DNA_ORIENTATION=+